MLETPQSYKRKLNYRIVGYDNAASYYTYLSTNPKLIIADDIETAEAGGLAEDTLDDTGVGRDTAITQIQFAVDKYNAVIFPSFDPYYKKLAGKILQLPNLRLSFNGWKFDYPILRANQVQEHDIAKCIDLMWAWKHYQPALPRSLQSVACLAGFPFAWKHLYGADMEMYGGADVCSLHFILEWLVPLMKARGIWDKSANGEPGGFIHYCQKLNPILQQASKAGLPVNNIKRLELREKLIGMRDKLDAELQAEIPDDIKNLEPKRVETYEDTETGERIVHTSYGFKREPKEVRIAHYEYDMAVKRIEERGKKAGSFESFVRAKYGLVQKRIREIDFTANGTREGSNKGDAKRQLLSGMDDKAESDKNEPNKFVSSNYNSRPNSNSSPNYIEVERWCRIVDFKASKDQLSKYIVWKGEQLLASKVREERELGKLYKIPTDKDGKETTRKDEILQLFEKTGDLVLQKNLEHRSLQTNITNYIPNWKPGLDGNVHTTFGFTAASGQLDSRRPNVLNCSKHTEIGQLFRRIIEAPEGYSFCEFDKKSFHVATMGYCANDPTYIRFSQLDPHSIFASYIMPKEWGKPIDFSLSDGEILDRCKWIKKRCKQEKESKGDRGVDLRQQVAKPAVLGNQLELGARKLYWQNRRSIEDVAHAKRLQDMLADLFPKVELFKHNIKEIAHKQTYLINEFGYIQWFFDVLNYRWDKKNRIWKVTEGAEAREPVAFRVQGCAFGMLKDEIFKIVLDRFRELDLSDPSNGRVYFPFRNTIHDSLVFLFSNSHLDTAIPIVLEEMNRACGKLVNEATGKEGLRVGVEYSVGRNWQGWNQEGNIEGMREV